MGVIIYSFNLNISSKMSDRVIQCDTVVTELHAYDFGRKDFVFKKGCYFCLTLHFAIMYVWQHTRKCRLYKNVIVYFFSTCEYRYLSLLWMNILILKGLGSQQRNVSSFMFLWNWWYRSPRPSSPQIKQ